MWVLEQWELWRRRWKSILAPWTASIACWWLCMCDFSPLLELTFHPLPVDSRVVERPAVLRRQVAVKCRSSHHTDVEQHSGVLKIGAQQKLCEESIWIFQAFCNQTLNITKKLSGLSISHKKCPTCPLTNTDGSNIVDPLDLIFSDRSRPTKHPSKHQCLYVSQQMCNFTTVHSKVHHGSFFPFLCAFRCFTSDC